MILKISTAWLQLKFQKSRLLVAIAGISFAVVLIFIQLSLRAALFDSSVALHKALQGDIFLISPRFTSLINMDSFSKRRLNQALAFEEVESVIPIYLGWVRWINPHNKIYWKNIYIIGLDISYPVLNLPGVQENINKLKLSDTVLFNEVSRPEFGAIAEDFQRQGGVTTEIVSLAGSGHRRITVVGLFKLDISFGVDGYLVTSDLNFLRILNQHSPSAINLGVIKLKTGYNINKFIPKLRQYLPKDIKTISKKEFIKLEKTFWDSNTPIGFAFWFGVVLGLIVGVIIVYQILYSNVTEYLAEYATLKALGYKHNYLLFVVFQQSFILAILGYIPGFIIANCIYEFSKNATKIPITMEIDRALIVLIITFIMCFLSGLVAVQKLKKIDPADVF